MSKRKGRRRKVGRRHPNGDLVTEREAMDNRTIVLNQPHRRWLPELKRLDQKAEHPLGGLSLSGSITDEEYEAGRQYARLKARERRVMSSRNPILRPMPGQGPDIDPEKAEKIRQEFNSAFNAIGYHKAQVAVAEVTIFELPCPRGQFQHLKVGLGRLVAHFGLTAHPKRARLPK